MDDQRFDALTRFVSTVTGRRNALASVAILLALLGRLLRGPGAAARPKPGLCRSLGQPCYPDRGIGCCGRAACRQGRCRCGRTQRVCRGRCIAKSRCCTNRDCRGGQRCRRGRCQCPPGQRKRGKRCVPANACASNQTRCAGACVNLKTAKGHCGECGNACAGTATCKQGVCVAGGEYALVRSWEPTLPSPYGIAVNRVGNVYATYPAVSQIWKFTGDGVEVDFWDAGLGAYPTGIDVNAAGLVFASLTDDRAVQRYTSDGSPDGPSFPVIDAPFGLAVNSHSGDIYVAAPVDDPGVIKRYAADGTLIEIWGPPDIPFGQPFGVAVAPNGDVYVTDWLLNRVQWFSATGVPRGEWGEGGDGDGQFTAPLGVTVDAAGFVYVADQGNDRVQKFTASGGFVGAFGGDSIPTPLDVAVSRTGMAYVTDDGGVIVQIQPD